MDEEVFDKKYKLSEDYFRIWLRNERGLLHLCICDCCFRKKSNKIGDASEEKKLFEERMEIFKLSSQILQERYSFVCNCIG